ncbi:MAG: hypothetical protein RLZZ628_2307 [Bacteroidota bacterium]|jgi:hypothetical protein
MVNDESILDFWIKIRIQWMYGFHGFHRFVRIFLFFLPKMRHWIQKKSVRIGEIREIRTSIVS